MKGQVVNMHRGLFQHQRLPIGVSSASAFFLRAIDTILQGLPSMVSYQDDILVIGGETDEHIKNLERVFWKNESFWFAFALDEM